MFFILSKTLNYLVMPLTMICIVFVTAFLTRSSKWKKRLLWTGLIMLLFFSNEFIANEVMLAWEIKPREIRSLPKYKLAIVLTGATYVYEPSDRVYFQRGADRVNHTVQLYKEGYIKKILISGGSGRLVGEREPEANQFKRAMIMMGVNGEDIIIENQTRNTGESAIEVKKMLSDGGFTDKDCVLITSAFHMRRSLACYVKQGMHPDVFTTDFFSHSRDFYLDTLIIPQIDALNIWHKLTREWAGFAAYKVAGYL
jgi:uncharacterized SAM-binding protein YcdF (DUF218 family)